MQSEGSTEEVPKEVKWLWQGSKTGDLEGVKRLLEKGADVNYPYGDSTSLHVASASGHLAIVELLLKHGAIPNAPMDPWYEANLEAGFAALHLAIREGHLEVARCLIENGADTEKCSWFPNLIRPIHLAMSVVSLEALQLLIRAGASVNARTGPEDGGRTPLHIAVDLEWIEAVELLLKSGCNMDLKNEDGKTAFELASKKIQSVLSGFRKAKL